MNAWITGSWMKPYLGGWAAAGREDTLFRRNPSSDSSSSGFENLPTGIGGIAGGTTTETSMQET